MKAPDANPPVHNARNFNWCGTYGSCEASDLAPLGVKWFGRVWQDACDVGMVLHSPRTGNDVLFLLKEEERSQGPDGDMISWIFESSDGSFTARVYND